MSLTAQTANILIERIEALVAANGNGKETLRSLLHDFHPADLAEVLDDLSEEAAVAVFALLTPEMAGEVLDETDDEMTSLLVERIPDEHLAAILDELPSDDAARLLDEMDDEQAETLIALMDPAEAVDVRGRLAYPDGTAGRLMSEEFIRLHDEWSVAHTLAYLREMDPDGHLVAHLYVTDDQERLQGIVPLRRLITAQPTQQIAEIATRRVISVRDEEEQEEVAEVVAKYDFAAVPVVDGDGRLVGVITVDDIVDVLEEEATEDIQRLGGSEALGQPYFSVPLWLVVRKRIVWLLLLFFGGTLTSTVMSHFDSVLGEVIALSYFIPLLIGTGGNAGSQTVSTVIRALGVGEVEWQDGLRVLVRELTTGLAVGVLLGIVAFTYARLVWHVETPLALVVGLTMPAITTWSKTVASIVPLGAEKIGIDPTVVSAPLITTVVDATGLAIYFLIAQQVLGL